MVPEVGHVRMNVYDALGQEVARVIDSRREAGLLEERLSLSGVGSRPYPRLFAITTRPRLSLLEYRGLSSTEVAARSASAHSPKPGRLPRQ